MPHPDRASGHAIPHHRLAQQWQSPTATSPRTIPSPPTSALIVAERRHSAITRYAERSRACRDSTRPCCRRAGGTLLPQWRSMTARAVTSSVNPRQRRGHAHDADAPRSVAAGTLRHCIYSGTALRCISPHPLSPDAVRG